MKISKYLNEKNVNNLINIVIIFLVCFIPFREYISYYTISYIKFLPDIIIFVTFVFLLLFKKIKIRFSASDIIILLFALVTFITNICLNQRGILPFLLELRSLFLYYVLYYILRNTKIEINWNLFSKVLSLVIFIVSIFSIVEKIFNKDFLFPNAWASSIVYKDNFARVYSVFNNPNTYATFIVLSFFLLNYLEYYKDIKCYKFIYILLLINLWLSASRSAMIIFAVYIFVYLILIIKNKYKDKLLNLLVIALISSICIFGISKMSNNYYFATVVDKKPAGVIDVIIDANGHRHNNPLNPNSNKYNSDIIDDIAKRESGGLINRILSLFKGNIYDLSTKDGRIYKIMVGIKVFKDYPVIGSGFGTFGDSASLMINPIDFYEKYDLEDNFYSDNQYLTIIVECGILGTVLMAAFVISLIIKYRKNILKLTVVFCVMILCLFYNTLEVQIAMFMFYLFLCLPEKENVNEK
jgi:O-antigen polymerase